LRRTATVEVMFQEYDLKSPPLRGLNTTQTLLSVVATLIASNNGHLADAGLAPTRYVVFP